MTSIRIYEPALCCNTGVCGPDVDQSLVTFTADLDYLKSRGADIKRINLTNNPSAFAEDTTVRTFMQIAGSEGLPLTSVDGVTVTTGAYPTRENLLHYAGLALESIVPADVQTLAVDEAAPTDCGPSGCC